MCEEIDVETVSPIMPCFKLNSDLISHKYVDIFCCG